MLDYDQVPRQFYPHRALAISGKAIVESLRKGKWRNADSIPNTPAWRYLERRGLIDCLAPGVLRYTRQQHLRHPGHDIPALVVARHSPQSGLIRGVQLMFLEEDGRKCWAIEKCKITFGGAGMNLRAEFFFAGLSRDLVICQGVESAIAAAKLFDCPAWAMCGPFPASLRLPSFVKHVLIADVRFGIAHRHRPGQHAPFRQRGEWDDDACCLRPPRR